MDTAASYLQPCEFEAYGLPYGSEAKVARASRLINAFCKRSRYGMIWVPGADGSPAYMAAATADMTWTSASPVISGQNVVVTVTGQPVFPEIIGRSVTLDAGNPALTEVCVITAINTPTPGSITLGAVQFNHTTVPLELQGGLQIFEERSLPQDRSIARLSQWPIAKVVSGIGRYSYGRRSQQMTGDFSEFNLLAILQQFGGPPAWVPFDPLQLGINPTTGEVWIPAGVLLAYYSETRLWYLAGWSAANVPVDIKQACANIAENYAVTEGLGGSMFKNLQAGDTKIERFADNAIDAETKDLLNSYRARVYA